MHAKLAKLGSLSPLTMDSLKVKKTNIFWKNPDVFLEIKMKRQDRQLKNKTNYRCFCPIKVLLLLMTS